MKNWMEATMELVSRIRTADRTRYCFLAVFLGCVHLLLAVVGFILMCLPLAFTNLAVAALDFLSICGTKNSRSYFARISILYFATCIQSLYACVLLGWSYGFSIYNLVMIPIMLSTVYLMEHGENSSRYTILYTLINCIATLVFCWILYRGDPIYYYPVPTDLKVCFFNNIMGFLLVLCFCVLFILELTVSRKEIRARNAELMRLANYDELTKLRNRRSLLEIWGNLKRNDYCVVMGDIDDFKKINDTYGHEQGDDVLKLVSGSMSGAVDAVDHVSRWGGEEFLMIVFGNIAYALKVVDRVQQELRVADLQAGGNKLTVTMTFGVCEASEVPSGDIDEIIRRADRRLYLGKTSGKNCIKIRDE